jgi:CRP-like cAMP-binding protein
MADCSGGRRTKYLLFQGRDSTLRKMSPSTDLLPDRMRESDYELLALQRLDAEEVAALARFGLKRTVAGGEHLFCTGDRDLSVFLILRGEAQVYFTRVGKERDLVVLGERHFIGDISMLTRMAAVASVRARGELEVIEKLFCQRIE